jgi:phage tail sheath protein FI
MSDPFFHGVETIISDSGLTPVQTPNQAVIGIIGTAPLADAVKFPLDTPININSLTAAAGIGATGTLFKNLKNIYNQASPIVQIIRVAEGADPSETITNIKGGTDAATGAKTGLHAFLNGAGLTGFKANLLIAPDFSNYKTGTGVSSAYPIMAEMAVIAEKLRATAFVDGPDTTNAAAIAQSLASGNKRIYLIDNFAKEGSAKFSPSAFVAAVASKINFWESPSNKELFGVSDFSRPLIYSQDYSNDANVLNEKNISCIIREKGFRIWGNRTLSIDPKTAFLATVRTSDAIAEALEKACFRYIDKPITRAIIDEIILTVNAYIADLVARGAILGGKAELDPDLNSPANFALGKCYINYDFTPAYALERLVFKQVLTTKYAQNLLTEIN